MRRTGLLVLTLGALLGSSVWWLSQPEQAAAEELLTRVVFEDPKPTGKLKVKEKKSEEECTTSCSLAKHPIPEFTETDFAEALRAYGQAPVEEVSEALEELLFHGPRTRWLIKELGTEGLPEAHLAYLHKELARDQATVSLRMVDEEGVVRVTYGPTQVPIGVKQHLMPVGENLQAMEFNGTVMRTGVNYLWSRY